MVNGNLQNVDKVLDLIIFQSNSPIYINNEKYSALLLLFIIKNPISQKIKEIKLSQLQFDDRRTVVIATSEQNKFKIRFRCSSGIFIDLAVMKSVK